MENHKSYTLPHASAPDYVERLMALCVDLKVGLVVPTLDTELQVLAENRENFVAIGCSLVVSEPEFVAVCNDKRKTAAHFSNLGLASPEIYSTENLKYPAIAKPYDGSLSKGIVVLRGPEDLTNSVRANKKIIYAQYLDPTVHEEFTCDAYFDRSYTLRCVVPRQRIEVRGGEVSKAIALNNEIVDYFFTLLNKLDGARGCITIQVMRNLENKNIHLIEVNPRFGGGYPLTSRVGGEYHDWLIKEYIEGKDISENKSWTSGVMMLRYDGEIYSTS